jgi:hypothetical protein
MMAFCDSQGHGNGSAIDHSQTVICPKKIRLSKKKRLEAKFALLTQVVDMDHISGY